MRYPLLILATVLGLLTYRSVHSEENSVTEPTDTSSTAVQSTNAANTTVAVDASGNILEVVPTIEPYRTFIEFQSAQVEQKGDPANPISNLRVEIKFPNKASVKLPGAENYWVIGDKQVQEVKQVFELPFEYVQEDGFILIVQMDRKDSWFNRFRGYKPCIFKVNELSQFNRKYVCKTDVAWQRNRKISEQNIDMTAIQIRVFTDKNSLKNEIPTDAIAVVPR